MNTNNTSSSNDDVPTATTKKSDTKSITTRTDESGGGSSAFTVRNSFLAGSAAGIASTIACHPFDVIRVKMQSSAQVVAAAAATATATTTNTTATKSLQLVETIRTTIRYGGGVQALYTGLAMPLVFQAIYKSTVFTVNRTTESFIQEWKMNRHKNNNNNSNTVKIPYNYQLTFTDRFVSGCMGGAINAILFCTPVEYVRNQQIIKIGNNNKSSKGNTIVGQQRKTFIPVGPISVIQDTIKKHRITGLWKGMMSTVLRDSVGCGFFFVAMAYAQEQMVKPPAATAAAYHPHQQQQQQIPSSSSPRSTSVLIISGAFAGVTYWIWALPIDTMKTWIQNGTASNLTDAFRISQRHGFTSLFRGYEVAYLRGAPSAAITVLTYSLVFQQLEANNNNTRII